MSRWIALFAAVALVACSDGSGTDTDTGTDDTDTNTNTGTDTNTTPNAWSEAHWCNPLADLSAVEAAHNPSDVRTTLEGIAAARYTPALEFIDAQSNSDLQNWMFMGTDYDGVMGAFEVAVHEGSHIWGFDHFSFDAYTYRVVDDSVIIEAAFLDNFARSEILDRHPYPQSDFYADTYLTDFSGSQGFNTVLDEFNAYAHSLVSVYCTRDTVAGATSARDGILTFMLYVELYLEIAREVHPADYAEITGDPGTVDAILSIWDRARYWLDITEGHDELGIDDDMIRAEVFDAARLQEIERLR